MGKLKNANCGKNNIFKTMSDFCTTDTLAYGEELTAPYENDNDKVLNTITYTGHEKDYETNLTYMMARYYSQGYGRFLSPDPGYDYDQLDPMSWNLYAYVRGNPVKNVDPTGSMVLGEGEYRAIKMAKIYHQGEDAIQRYDQMQKEVAKAGVVFGVAVYGSLATAYGGSVFIQSRYGQFLIGVGKIALDISVKAGRRVYHIIADYVKVGTIGYVKSVPYILLGDMASQENSKTIFKNQIILFGSNMIVPESALTYSFINLGISYITFVLNKPDASISMIRNAIDVLNTLVIQSGKLGKIGEGILTFFQQALEDKMEQAMKREKEEKEKQKKKQIENKYIFY